MRAIDARRYARLTAVAVLLSLAVAAGFAAFGWVADRVTPQTAWKSRLAFLIALEILHGATLVVLVLAIPILAALLVRASRRSRAGRPIMATAVLVGALTAAMLTAEAAAWFWWHRTHRSSAVPVGGLRRGPRKDRQLPTTPPAEIALPEQFEERPPGAPREILILGESSAEGVPYNYWGSLTHIVTWQLERVIPGLRIQPWILAASGNTLERQHERLAEITRRPDAIVVYCGHNEFLARFDWAREVDHYLDGKVPSLWARVVQVYETTSPIGRLLRESADKCRVAIPPPEGGYRSLVDVPAYTPAEFEALLADFERRLDAIVAYAERIQAVPILIAPPASDSGYEPNRSFLPPETTAAERAAFEREFQAIRRREEREPERCLADYRALLEHQPGFAELHYRVARLLERRGEYEDAYEHDRAARDLDGLPSRCPTRFQEAYRRVAARRRCPLIDGQEYFHRISPHGLLDDHLFHDGLHPSLRGQIALAQAVLQALRERKAFDWPASTPVPQVDPAACVSYFALVPQAWRKICLWGVTFYDLTAPARYDPTERNRRSAAFSRAAKRIEEGAGPEDVGLVNIGTPEPVPLVPDAAAVPPLERSSNQDIPIP